MAPEDRISRRRWAIAFVLICLPFFINDFSGIYVKDWRLWLFIDYTAVKLYPLIIFLWMLKKKYASPADFGLGRIGIGRFIVVLAAAAVLGVLVDQVIFRLIERSVPDIAIGHMPRITSTLFDWIDLTFGLLAVGFFEELIFRGFACGLMEKYTKSKLLIIIIPSVIFSLIHWSLGIPTLVGAFLIGSIFMALYLKTRNILPLALAHFLINFLFFSGCLPPGLFDFTPK